MLFIWAENVGGLSFSMIYSFVCFFSCFSSLFRLMFWSDAGSSPKIGVSWMDGTKGRIIVSEKLGYPSSVAVDYESVDHRLYWTDSKANLIESSKQDGSDRVVVIRGDHLQHPISIDLFEDQIYWLTRETGDVYRQDKFGRGVKVRVKRALEHATDIKVLQPYKYNTSCK